MNRRTTGFIAVVLVSSALGTLLGLHLHSQRNADPLASAYLFSANLPDTDGTSQALSKWAGKTLLVNFWAPWCAPCVQEIPELSALQTEIGTPKIQIIGIGIDSKENISRFSSRVKIAYPLYAANMRGIELSEQLGNRTGSLPFSVLIGEDGQVSKTYSGSLKLTELRTDLIAFSRHETGDKAYSDHHSGRH